MIKHPLSKELPIYVSYIEVLQVSYIHRDTAIILSYKLTTEYNHTISFITGPGLRLVTKT